jgi:PKD repeat protein
LKNLLLGLSLFISFCLFSQNITFDNVPPLSGGGSTGNGAGVMFNFTTNQNIVIQNFRGAFNNATGSVTVWYNLTKISSAPGPTSNINPSNGWIALGTNTMTGLSPSLATPIVQTIPVPINLTLNAGDTIGIALYWNGTVYTSTNVNIPTFSNGTVTIIADASCAYAYNSTDSYGPRQVNGGVIYQLADPCVNPPFVGNALTSNHTPCTGQNFTLSLDSVTAGQGQSYQWQISSDNNSWINIAGATYPTLQTSQSSTNHYRCVLNCGTGTATSGAVMVTTTTNPLSGGIYTINNTLPTSGSNFQSFHHFSNAVACHGIGGHIVLNVANTGIPYNEQIHFGSLLNNGANASITINGNGASLIAAGGSQNRATLTLDAVQYVTVNNLRIETTASSNAYAVELRNDARYIVFNGCEIVAPITSIAISSAAFVSSNAPASAITAGLAMRDVQVKNCLIEGGYYGIVVNGPLTAPWATNNVVENCVIRDFYSYGLYIRGQENSAFIGNEITRPLRTNTATTYGIAGTSAMVGVRIQGNSIHNLGDQLTTNSSACYPIYFSAALGTAVSPCIIANNLVYNNFMNGVHCGMYVHGVSNYLNFYHNTVYLNNPTANNAAIQQAVFISSTNAGQFEFKNNIFNIEHSGSGEKYCFFRSSIIPNVAIDYNQYHINSGGNTNFIGYQTSIQTTFAQWQLAGNDNNGVLGDPVFASLATNNLTPMTGFGNNLAQNLNLIVPTDFNGVTRTASPDIGAIEYTPIADDIALLSGEIARGQCLSTNDTVRLTIQNVIGSAVDFALNPLTIAWTVSGPVNSNGTIVINTGSLALLGTLTVEATTANLSQVGVYTLTVHLVPNAMNLAAGNDTLSASQVEVTPQFLSATPSSALVISAQTVVDVTAQGSFLPTGYIYMSEICHFRGSTVGTPIGGWPSYLIADDYVELTGVPNMDISGYIFESYTATALNGGSHVLPAGTVFGPNGTMILAIGQLGSSVPSPANYYYHTGGTVTFGSTVVMGHVLKDPQGNVVDAVAYGNYTFPAVSGVTAADWTGTTPAVGSTGNRLQGPDLNNSTGWINSGTSPQTPNVVNQNIIVTPAQGVSGFTWTLNGVVVDTVPNTTFGPWSQDGVYHYVANHITPCGTFTDTATITVILPCDNPNNASYTSPTCGELFVSWNSVPNRVNSSLEYGPAGFTPGTGSITLGASSPLHITGLTGNTDYDIYIVDTCANGFSNSTLLTATTFGAPLPTVSATFNQTSTGATSATVSFDASASADYSSLSWDFGDGSTATGATVDHTYSANQNYTVVLTGTNNCGTTTQTYQVTVAGIGLESEISQTLSVYPNPNRGVFSITFSSEIKDDVQISITNATGQLIGEWNNASVQGQFKQDFDLSRYPAGVYFMKISSNQVTTTKQIILTP